jgi:hypothetical protein
MKLALTNLPPTPVFIREGSFVVKKKRSSDLVPFERGVTKIAGLPG